MAVGAFREIRYNATAEFTAFRDVWCDPNSSQMRLLAYSHDGAAASGRSFSKLEYCKALAGYQALTAERVDELKKQFLSNLTTNEIRVCEQNIEKAFGRAVSIAEIKDQEDRVIILRATKLVNISGLHVSPTKSELTNSSATDRTRTMFVETEKGTRNFVEEENGDIDFSNSFSNGVSYVFDTTGHGVVEKRKKLLKLLDREKGPSESTIGRLERNLKEINLMGDIRDAVRRVIAEFAQDLEDEKVSVNGALVISMVVTIEGKQYALIFQNGDAKAFIFNKDNELIFETKSHDSDVTSTNETLVYAIEVKEGDKVILASDGVYEFLYPKRWLCFDFQPGQEIKARVFLDNAKSRIMKDEMEGNVESGFVYMTEEKNIGLVNQSETGKGREGLGKKQWDPRQSDNWDDISCAVTNVGAAKTSPEKASRWFF